MTDRVDAVAELKRIIEDSLGAERIASLRITPYLDHADEPAYSIGVTMTFEKDIPDSRRQSELTSTLIKRLTELDNPRFPYLWIDALDSERPDVDDDYPSPED